LELWAVARFCFNPNFTHRNRCLVKTAEQGFPQAANPESEWDFVPVEKKTRLATKQAGREIRDEQSKNQNMENLSGT